MSLTLSPRSMFRAPVCAACRCALRRSRKRGIGRDRGKVAVAGRGAARVRRQRAPESQRRSHVRTVSGATSPRGATCEPLRHAALICDLGGEVGTHALEGPGRRVAESRQVGSVRRGGEGGRGTRGREGCAQRGEQLLEAVAVRRDLGARLRAGWWTRRLCHRRIVVGARLGADGLWGDDTETWTINDSIGAPMKGRKTKRKNEGRH